MRIRRRHFIGAEAEQSLEGSQRNPPAIEAEDELVEVDLKWFSDARD
jgi:hypothetical protein